MTLQLKAAKRVLLAAGYDESEISELVRGIKAAAWDKGYEMGEMMGLGHQPLDYSNPYRKAPPNYTEGDAK